MLKRFAFSCWFLLIVTTAYGASVIGDPDFDVSVETPTFTLPEVVFDASHYNLHRIDKTYAPFANILRNDGYHVSSWNQGISALHGHKPKVNIFVINNALGDPQEQFQREPPFKPAFSPEECLLLDEWVSGGSSLLIITDHVPWAFTMETLLNQFGASGSRSLVRCDGNSNILFGPSRIKGRIFMNRYSTHEDASTTLFGDIESLETFGGQAIKGPKYALDVLLLTGNCTFDSNASSVPDIREYNSQGTLYQYGFGKIAIFGEAAMFTAQTVDTMRTKKMGMNTGDNQNKAFVLEVFHWLSGLNP